MITVDDVRSAYADLVAQRPGEKIAPDAYQELFQVGMRAIAQWVNMDGGITSLWMGGVFLGHFMTLAQARRLGVAPVLAPSEASPERSEGSPPCGEGV